MLDSITEASSAGAASSTMLSSSDFIDLLKRAEGTSSIIESDSTIALEFLD
jgi:hypothetical protein